MRARARFIAWENLIALAACPHYASVQTQHTHTHTHTQSNAARAHGPEYAYRDQAEPSHGLFAVNTRSDAGSLSVCEPRGNVHLQGTFRPIFRPLVYNFKLCLPLEIYLQKSRVPESG